MSLSAIQQITDIEQQAKDCVSEANANARLIVQEARQQADLQYTTVQKTALEKAAEITSAARTRSESTSQYILEQARVDCANLREQAQNKMDAAVSKVIERVVSG